MEYRSNHENPSYKTPPEIKIQKLSFKVLGDVDSAYFSRVLLDDPTLSFS